MSKPKPQEVDPRIAQLRRAIKAIEATSADLKPAAKPTTADPGEPQARTDSQRTALGDDWMQKIPARYHHGQRGFDRHLMHELAAAGVRCYTVQDLRGSPLNPEVVNILVDWLTHLDTRIPGPESQHHQAIRNNIIDNLNSTAMRGNQQVFDLLIAQMLHTPPLPGMAADAAGYAIAKIATKHDFPRIAALIEQLPPGVPKGALIEYMGKVKTPAAREIALSYLDTEWTYFSIKALIAMRAPGVRERIEPYLQSPNSFIRKYARRAMKVLPAE